MMLKERPWFMKPFHEARKMAFVHPERSTKRLLAWVYPQIDGLVFDLMRLSDAISTGRKSEAVNMYLNRIIGRRAWKLHHVARIAGGTAHVRIEKMPPKITKAHMRKEVFPIPEPGIAKERMERVRKRMELYHNETIHQQLVKMGLSDEMLELYLITGYLSYGDFRRAAELPKVITEQTIEEIERGHIERKSEYVPDIDLDIAKIVPKLKDISMKFRLKVHEKGGD